MRKLSLIVAMLCVFMVACTNNSSNGQKEEPAIPEQTCDQQKPCPFAEIETLFADWDNMTDEAKAEAVKAAKAKFDELEANFPKHECKKSCSSKCVEGCSKDGKCNKEEGKPCCKAEGEMPCHPKHECNKESHECDQHCTHQEGEKPCCKDKPEITEEMKAEMEAKKAEMKAKIAEMQENWANFDNLSVDDQKAVIDAKLCMMKHHGGHHGGKHCDHKTCDKHCDKPCEKPAE